MVAEKVPSDAIVLFAVGFEEGGGVGDGALNRAAGEGVVQEGFGDLAGLHVGYVFPAEGDVLFVAVVALDAVTDTFVEIGFTGFARQADADQAFAGGEDDATVLVVPGVGFVLAHHRELHAVDGEQFIQSHA